MEVSFIHDPSPEHSLFFRAYALDYRYVGNYLYSPGASGDLPVVYRDQGHATWGGLEARSTLALGGGHQMVSGVEMGWVGPAEYRTYDVAPRHTYTRMEGSHQWVGAYVQADWQVADPLVLPTGARVDRASAFGARLSPRLGLIYKPAASAAIKFLAGGGFRNPADSERIGPDDSLLNQRPERVRNLEVTLEHYLDARHRLTLALYHYRVDDMLASDAEGYFRNQGRVAGKGMELELERLWDSGARMRASISRNLSEGPDGRRLLASPGWIAKLNGSAPLGTDWRLAWETQGITGWRSHAGAVGGYGVSNLSLVNSRRGGGGLEWGLQEGNVFDQDHADPEVTDWASSATGGRIQQPGRTLRMKASWLF
ncbi:MAG: TonB-dependent receptor [Rhodocyclaceae bacterium]|nr:TonB-dependent receptor [Rhodocyclaceae bacterium]